MTTPNDVVGSTPELDVLRYRCYKIVTIIIIIIIILLLCYVLKRHGPFVAFILYCKIMLCGIKYTYYSVKTVKICFHVPFRG